MKQRILNISKLLQSASNFATPYEKCQCAELFMKNINKSLLISSKTFDLISFDPSVPATCFECIEKIECRHPPQTEYEFLHIRADSYCKLIWKEKEKWLTGQPSTVSKEHSSEDPSYTSS